MNLLIFEYFCGGGRSNYTLNDNLIQEARALLSQLLIDFAKLKEFNITTSLDIRAIKKLDKRAIQNKFPAQNRVFIKKPKKDLELFTSLLDYQQHDAALIIAPETNDILANLTALAENKGLIILGPNSNTIKILGDKWFSYLLFKQNNISQPKTYLLKNNTPTEIKELIKKEQLSFPLCLKPRDGFASEILYLNSWDNHKSFSPYLERNLILQEFITGSTASISLLKNSQQTTFLSLNLQKTNENFSYIGGEIGVNHPLKKQIVTQLNNTLTSFSGLKGYLGVDLILKEENFFFLEVNPRLTSSYIGLTAALKEYNLAQLIVDASLDRTLPQNLKVDNLKFNLKKR